MRRKGKRIKPGKLVDKFSDLPDNVIDLILSRIPFRDAVRISILSTKWRFHWTRIETLVLDNHFFYSALDRRQKGELMVSAYADIVGNILLSHSGPIRKFVLHVPNFGDTPAPGDINQWILFVSQHGVQDLTIESDHDIKIPSSVFQCTELKHLCLKYVELKLPPPSFSTYSSLVSLDLCCQYVSGDTLTNMILNCPMLERFWLDYFGTKAKYGTFFLNAPKLKLLSVTYYYFIDFILKNTPNISTLSMKEVGAPLKARNKGQDIVDFFGAISKVENINLTGDVLEEWAQQRVPEQLPVPLENHYSLSVRGLNMYSLAQIRSMFCLIKSSPKLQSLDISMYKGCTRNKLRDIRHYLQSQLMEADNLRSLKIVKVAGFAEREPWIVFIQVTLSCCPLLEKLYLKSGYILSSAAEFKMMTDLMRFPRASTKAEIIYSKLK